LIARKKGKNLYIPMKPRRGKRKEIGGCNLRKGWRPDLPVNNHRKVLSTSVSKEEKKRRAQNKGEDKKTTNPD